MDRKAHKLPLKKEGLSRWACPSCKKGFLKVKADTFHVEETKESKKEHRHEAWDPDWIRYVYSCLLECTNPTCKDTVSNSGTGSVDIDIGYDDDGSPIQTWEDYFTPKHFTPHLKIFNWVQILSSPKFSREYPP